MERDPDVVLGWLAQRADPDRGPVRPVVLELRPSRRPDRRYWLVLEGGREANGCLRDPLLDESRYVYVDASMRALLALAKGRCNWTDAFRDGSVTAAGDPDLVHQLAGWFRAPERMSPSWREKSRSCAQNWRPHTRKRPSTTTRSSVPRFARGLGGSSRAPRCASPATAVSSRPVLAP
jgi:hypothetical protein